MFSGGGGGDEDDVDDVADMYDAGDDGRGSDDCGASLSALPFALTPLPTLPASLTRGSRSTAVCSSMYAGRLTELMRSGHTGSGACTTYPSGGYGEEYGRAFRKIGVIVDGGP
jgi:hypothetical protein